MCSKLPSACASVRGPPIWLSTCRRSGSTSGADDGRGVSSRSRLYSLITPHLACLFPGESPGACPVDRCSAFTPRRAPAPQPPVIYLQEEVDSTLSALGMKTVRPRAPHLLFTRYLDKAADSCAESCGKGCGFYKVLQDALFFLCCLSWDIKQRQS